MTLYQKALFPSPQKLAITRRGSPIPSPAVYAATLGGAVSTSPTATPAAYAPIAQEPAPLAFWNAPLPPPNADLSQVCRLSRNVDVLRLAQAHHLDVVDVAWEDMSRWKQSCFGSNITDATLRAKNYAERCSLHLFGFPLTTRSRWGRNKGGMMDIKPLRLGGFSLVDQQAPRQTHAHNVVPRSACTEDKPPPQDDHLAVDTIDSLSAPLDPMDWARSGELWPGRSRVQQFSPGVHITNFFGARDRARLKENAITHVIVCADELPELFPDVFVYLRLSGLIDNTGTDLLQPVRLALPWIKKAVDRGGHVLLHCATGSSRSGAIACAYLMWTQGVTFAEALTQLRASRPIVSPNPGLCEQLARGLPSIGP